jgi:nucleoid DNA-binding protein
MDKKKEQIINEVADELGFDRKEIRELIKFYERVLYKGIKAKEDAIRFYNFGVFKLKNFTYYEDKRNQAGK